MSILTPTVIGTGVASGNFNQPGGVNRIAIYCMVHDNTEITTTPQYGGVNMTEAKDYWCAAEDSQAAIWYMLDEDLPANGANAIPTISDAGLNYFFMIQNAVQGGPTNNGTGYVSDTDSLTVNCTIAKPNEIAIGCTLSEHEDNLWTTGPGTELYDNNNGSDAIQVSYVLNPAVGTYGYAWTYDRNQAHVGVVCTWQYQHFGGANPVMF